MDNRATWLGRVGAALLLMSSPSEAQDLDAERQAVRARFAGEAEVLADWAQEHRLYLRRDRLYGALLALQPDHAEARRFLRYRKTKSGWEQQRYSPPQDRGPEHVAEFDARRATLESAWCAALEDLAKRHAKGRGAREDGWLYDDLLILAPDNAHARSRRGEVQAEEGWILQETSAGRARRAHLQARAAELRAAIPPFESASAAAGAIAGWHEARLPVGRVVAADLNAEALSILALAEGAAALFREVLGEAPILPDDLTVVVLDGPEARREFLAEHDALVRGMAEEHDSLWLPRSATLVLCGPTPELRRAHGVRQLLQRMLQTSYGLGPAHTWALEGFSLRLGELLTGSADFVRNAGTPIDWKKGAHMWREARALLADEPRPRLAWLTDLPGKTFAHADFLLSYALACYLIEARPEGLARLMDEIGHGGSGADERPVAEILEHELGLDLAALDARLARWAAEIGE